MRGRPLSVAATALEFVAVPAGEVGALGEVLAQQAIGVLVGAALPRAVRVGEEDLDAGIGLQLGVLGHLLAAVPGQCLAQRAGQGGDGRGDRVPDGLGAVPGQRRAVLDPFLARRSLPCAAGAAAS